MVKLCARTFPSHRHADSTSMTLSVPTTASVHNDSWSSFHLDQSEDEVQDDTHFLPPPSGIDWTNPPQGISTFPALGAYIVLEIDAVATLSHLKDSIVDEATRAMATKKYVGFSIKVRPCNFLVLTFFSTSV